ncbi:Rqc2 family fibronectin-binding protein, partial [Peptoniphilus indolicus]|uniref:Rqc2 family fibronectin-binding protein n=1 Tax=Peptoniphilus indolicus TaxID=33030 RepID=UPI00058CBD40
IKNQIVSDKSSELKKKIKNLINRETNKLQKQLKEFEQSKDRDKYKIYADLISSNLYRIEPGVKSIEIENFYDEMKPITISMDNKISPQANANKYYKKFAKLKNANLKLKDEIERTESSIEYLKSVLFSLELSESSDDIDEIREELYEMNYLKKRNSKNKKGKLKISQLTNENGDTIYCGKNNKQNEYLTLKFAGQNDIWFHVQNAPGSHVILRNNSGDFPESSILQAAKLAATNSSLKSSNNIPVDYTLKKYVKRHPSKIPGLVTYTNFKTIIIKID